VRTDAARRRVSLLGRRGRRDAAQLPAGRGQAHDRRRRHDRRHLRVLFGEAHVQSRGLRSLGAMGDGAFKDRLAAAAAAVEAELDARLAFAPVPGEPFRPQRLIEAMRYSTLGGVKRLRAFLAIETARALGRDGAGPVRAAAAIECLHAYSLIHDDLPAMDDDDLRRGRPTAHRAFDEATAILAGDALQTLAFEILADTHTDPDAEIRAALCAGLARAAGLGGMVGGQMLDIA